MADNSPVNSTNFDDPAIKENPPLKASTISHLSNQELEFNLKDLVSKERRLLHVILKKSKPVDFTWNFPEPSKKKRKQPEKESPF